jgi:gluconate kinase
MSTRISQKKPKGKPLSDDDRMLNRVISTVRIKVEHAIAGVKRCRIVKDIFRNTLPGMSDVVIEIACALHNLRVDMRYGYPR